MYGSIMSTTTSTHPARCLAPVPRRRAPMAPVVPHTIDLKDQVDQTAFFFYRAARQYAETCLEQLYELLAAVLSSRSIGERSPLVRGAFFFGCGHATVYVRKQLTTMHASNCAPYAHDEMSDLTTTQSTRPSRLVISEVWAGGASIYGERVHPCTRVLPPHHVCSCLVTSWSLRIDDAPVRACFLNTYTRASCVARPADGRT